VPKKETKTLQKLEQKKGEKAEAKAVKKDSRAEKKSNKDQDGKCTAADHFKSRNPNNKGYPADIADKVADVANYEGQDRVTQKYGFDSNRFDGFGGENFNKNGKSADKFEGNQNGKGKAADTFEGSNGNGKGKAADKFEHTAEGGCRLVQKEAQSLA
jgi:hypothetical protein